MELDFHKVKDLYVKSFGDTTIGWEFIVLLKSTGETELFENKLASLGYWVNDNEVSQILDFLLTTNPTFKETNKNLFEIGDEIIIKSYKNRGYLDFYKLKEENKITPDCTRGIWVK